MKYVLANSIEQYITYVKSMSSNIFDLPIARPETKMRTGLRRDMDFIMLDGWKNNQDYNEKFIQEAEYIYHSKNRLPEEL